jgi:uncharacterized protein (TIGR02757 family)
VDKELACIRDLLERLYARYNRRELIAPDPLAWVYKYERRADREVVGFIGSALAYGRVEQINKSVTKLFGIMGARPAEFAGNFSKGDRRKFAGFKHRFNTGEDIADFLQLIKFMLDEYGSIDAYFLTGYKSEDANIIPALAKFCELLLERVGGAKDRPGLKFLLSNPEEGSACKRLNLFLRWMVRKDDVDTGLWKKIGPEKLIVPVDVHMGRLSAILGFHSRKNLGIKAAQEITAGFAQINPADPVKYDFCLTRIGIVEGCGGKIREGCRECELLRYCTKMNAEP